MKTSLTILGLTFIFEAANRLHLAGIGPNASTTGSYRQPYDKRTNSGLVWTVRDSVPVFTYTDGGAARQLPLSKKSAIFETS